MIDRRDPRVRELFYELVDSAPPAPAFSELHSAAVRHRRRVVLAAAGVVSIVTLTAIGWVLVADRSTSNSSSSSVRVDARPTTQQATLAYSDPAKPPPIRVVSGSMSVDVTTVLGCWFHTPGDAAGHGVGVCADGSTDPSRFRLRVPPGTRVTLQLPIDAQLSAFLGDAPAPPAPHALAAPVPNRRPLELSRSGPREWSFSFRGADHDLALLIDVTANTNIGHVRVSGDAHYGLTLATGS